MSAAASARRWPRVFFAAFLLFLLSLVAPPGSSQPPAETPPATRRASVPSPPAAPADEVGSLLQDTAADMPAATPAERRAWAGTLAARGDFANAKRLAGKPPDAAARAKLVAELIRRGQAEFALPLLDADRGTPHPDAAWLRAAAHWQLGELALVPRDLAEVPPAERGAATLVEQLVAMTMRGQPPGLRHNPWQVSFLDAAGRWLPPAAGVGPAVPPAAAAELARWLRVQPNDGGAWALLALAMRQVGAADAALECLLRAEARGQASKELFRLKDELLFARAERNRAALAGTDDSPASPAIDLAPAPAAFDPVSFRALAAAGFGGVVLGLLLGLQMRSWLSRRRAA